MYAPIVRGCLIAIVVDHRRLMDENIWAKPTKFAVSIGLNGLSTLWLLRRLPDRRRHRVTAGLLAVFLLAEQVLISVQAYRGVRSHFNTTTPFDSALFRAMGGFVVCAWVCLFVLALAAMRTPQTDMLARSVTSLGPWIVVVGSSVGFVMVAINRHSIGGSDGGPMVPFLGWNSTIGDLRPAHFVGLHALQVLIVVAFVCGRVGMAPSSCVVAVRSVATFVFALMIGLAVQASFAQSVVSVSSFAVFGASLLVTALSIWRQIWPRLWHRDSRPLTSEVVSMKSRSRFTGIEMLYLTASIAGAVGTWWFNLHSLHVKGGYLQGWFANAASSSAAVDVIVVALAACVFMIVEGRRVGLKRLWLYPVLSMAIAIACMFPLFLFMRSRKLATTTTV
jgi:Terpene cyclase DEP1